MKNILIIILRAYVDYSGSNVGRDLFQQDSQLELISRTKVRPTNK